MSTGCITQVASIPDAPALTSGFTVVQTPALFAFSSPIFFAEGSKRRKSDNRREKKKKREREGRSRKRGNLRYSDMLQRPCISNELSPCVLEKFKRHLHHAKLP